MTLREVFSSIANAIRSKTGKTDTIKPVDMATEIGSIQTGGGDNKLPQLVDGSLTTITAEDLAGVTKIRDYAFWNCFSLTSITLPDSIISIGSGAFSNCSALTRITIPNSVQNIGANALRIGSSTNKATITMKPTNPPTIYSTTFNTSKLNKIIVPVGCGDAYKSSTNWSDFADYIEEATA